LDFTIECEREQDGRWLAEVPQLPGVLSYGASPDEAIAKAEVLALALCPNSLPAQREQQGRQDGVPNVRNRAA